MRTTIGPVTGESTQVIENYVIIGVDIQGAAAGDFEPGNSAAPSIRQSQQENRTRDLHRKALTESSDIC